MEQWLVRAWKWEDGEKKLVKFASGLARAHSARIHKEWFQEGWAMVDSRRLDA